jgi:TolB-like protein/DNA-binding winged helix-turn-helix (wHTH) protein/Tfp pilus assembly protein PilF
LFDEDDSPPWVLTARAEGANLGPAEKVLAMEPSMQPREAVRIGVFEVDFVAGELRKRGIKIKLHRQPFQVLSILLEHAGQVVTKEELSRKLWEGDTFVDFEHSLATAISKIREALGDSADSPRYVETLPRRGYRFIAEVSVVSGSSVDQLESAAGDLSAAIDPSPIERAGTATGDKRTRWSLASKISALALALMLAILAVWTFRPGRGSSASPPPPAPIRSLAVLPLESLSSDASQEYFADGMTDELITDLGQISALRVISRTSTMQYKGARKPLPQIARELDVDGVVEGTVLRSGQKVRITAQLIRAAADQHLWSNSYEGDLGDTLALQSKVAREIAEQIRIHLTPQEKAALKSVKAVNPEAYEAYLKGRYFWNKRTADGLKKAADYFNQAIEKDPNYAPAYTGLADSYALLGDWEYGVLPPKEAYPKAKAAATTALELDHTLSEAHTSLAFSLDGFDWDWESAEREFKRAIELNPNYATAHHWYGWHLSVLGRHSEAIAELRKAESLDPLSLIISADVAEELLIAHQYDESIKQSRKTVDMDSNFALAHYELGQAYVQKHMYNEAIRELQTSIALSGGSTTCTSNLAYAYAVSGQKSEAARILNALTSRPAHRFSNASEIALIYVGLDNKDQAMIWLEKAYAERFNPGILMRPAFDSLRSDPRFQDLLRRIGLTPQSAT